VGLWHETCGSVAAGLTAFSVVTISGTLKLYSGMDEFQRCDYVRVWQAALAPPPPSYAVKQCTTAPTWPNVTQPGAEVSGVFAPAASARCNASCSAVTTSCKYGCVVCADNSAVGLYGDDCSNLAAPMNEGDLVTVYGVSLRFRNLQDEFKMCAAVVKAPALPPVGPVHGRARCLGQSGSGCRAAIAALVLCLMGCSAAVCFAAGVHHAFLGLLGPARLVGGGASESGFFSKLAEAPIGEF